MGQRVRFWKEGFVHRVVDGMPAPSSLGSRDGREGNVDESRNEDEGEDIRSTSNQLKPAGGDILCCESQQFAP